jgi:hypothetical protein
MSFEEEALGGVVAGREQAGGGECVAGHEHAWAGGEVSGEAVGLVDHGGGDAEELATDFEFVADVEVEAEQQVLADGD